jgi:hypothetical protein
LGLTGQLYSLIIILFRFDNIFIHLLWSCSTTFFLGQRRDDLSFNSKLIIIAAPKLASNTSSHSTISLLLSRPGVFRPSGLSSIALFIASGI